MKPCPKCGKPIHDKRPACMDCLGCCRRISSEPRQTTGDAANRPINSDMDTRGGGYGRTARVGTRIGEGFAMLQGRACSEDDMRIASYEGSEEYMDYEPGEAGHAS